MLEHVFVVSAYLFSIDIYGMITSQSMIIENYPLLTSASIADSR